MPTKSTNQAFRCSIAPEHSCAVLRIGWRQFPTNVVDTSRDGFTIRCSPPIAARLEGKRARLTFRSETWEIEPYRSYSESDDSKQIGCRRIRDLTRVKEPKTSLLSLWGPRISASNDPGLLMFLLVVFIIACVSMPGLGDKLGTAPRIRSGIGEVTQIFRSDR